MNEYFKLFCWYLTDPVVVLVMRDDGEEINTSEK